MKSKIASQIFTEEVRKKLFGENNGGGTEVTGMMTFIVKGMCRTSENPDAEIPQEFTLQAKSAEDAKARAMAISKEMNHSSCKIVDVNTVVDPIDNGQFGLGKSLGQSNDAENGQVKPSDVSKKLPDLDA
jgi:hypothetical protein